MGNILRKKSPVAGDCQEDECSPCLELELPSSQTRVPIPKQGRFGKPPASSSFSPAVVLPEPARELFSHPRNYCGCRGQVHGSAACVKRTDWLTGTDGHLSSSTARRPQASSFKSWVDQGAQQISFKSFSPHCVAKVTRSTSVLGRIDACHRVDEVRAGSHHSEEAIRWCSLHVSPWIHVSQLGSLGQLGYLDRSRVRVDTDLGSLGELTKCLLQAMRGIKRIWQICWTLKPKERGRRARNSGIGSMI